MILLVILFRTWLQEFGLLFKFQSITSQFLKDNWILIYCSKKKFLFNLPHGVCDWCKSFGIGFYLKSNTFLLLKTAQNNKENYNKCFWGNFYLGKISPNFERETFGLIIKSRMYFYFLFLQTKLLFCYFSHTLNNPCWLVLIMITIKIPLLPLNDNFINQVMILLRLRPYFWCLKKSSNHN